jgi:2-phosphosulfolactate phosphatase
MTRELVVHLLPELATPDRFEGAIAVVLDVLRASTTITHALAAGAASVVPCETVDEARRVAATFPPASVLLGGERGGTRIEGFDLVNSPATYSADVVAGKTVVFTTTNGTRALRHARAARRRLIGCFSNLNGLLDLLIRESSPVHLLCAGTNGRISSEDVLCAGALARGFGLATGQATAAFDDQTQIAISLYETCADNPERFRNTLHTSRGGRNLHQLGLDADIDVAASWDVLPIVPELMPAAGRIQPAADFRPITTRWLHAPGEPVNLVLTHHSSPTTQH